MSVIDKDRGWKSIKKLADQLASQDVHVRVGVLDDGKAGSKERGRGLTNGMLAVIHEFGARRIPARSWIGRTFDRKRDEVRADSTKLLRHLLDGKITINKALGVLGAKYANEVKNTVTQGDPIPPPNAKSTLRKKLKLTRKGSRGSPRTLVDTGRMVGSVSWDARTGGPK